MALGVTINAANTSFAAVSAAVALANNGDTVVVPPGSSTWASTLTVTRNIVFQGAGTNSTFITANADSTPILDFQPATGFGEVSGFTFNGGGHQSYGAINLGGIVRVDHCVFTNFSGHVIDATGDHGVIDHCTFLNYNLGVEVRDSGWGGHNYGDGSWADNAYLGTTNALYIENCYFHGNGQIGAIDSVDGAHWVFRYNTVVNDILDSHGTETTQRERGTRAVEIYNNNLSGGPSFAEMFELRSGTGVIFSNTVSSYSSLVSMKTWRLLGSYTPWGGATGVNPWDKNGQSTFASGSAMGPNGSSQLIDTTKSWTANQWINYSVLDTTTGSGAQLYANAATTLSYNPNNFGNYIAINNGDHYEITAVLVALDQPGRGKGDLLADTSPGGGIPYDTVTGKTNWPSEASEPIYIWGNTLNGVNNNSIGIAWAGLETNGVDYHSGTAMPGYTPLVYPHPLVGGSVGGLGLTNSPLISLSAGNLDFGSIQAGTTSSLSITVSNAGTGVLLGTATALPPFSIISGGSYSLGANLSQVVTVGYSPKISGTNSGTIAFGSAATAALNGSAWPVLTGNSWSATAGLIMSPFTVTSNYISQAVETDVSTTGGEAIYGFTITNAGYYLISANVNAPNDNANSLYINIDAEPTDPTMIWDINPPFEGIGFTNAFACWRGAGTTTNDEFSPKVFSLSAGVHELIIRGREANTEFNSVSISPYRETIQPPTGLTVTPANP